MIIASTKSETSRSKRNRNLILLGIVLAPLLVCSLASWFGDWVQRQAGYEGVSKLWDACILFLFLIIYFAGYPIASKSPKCCRNWAIILASLIPLYVTIYFVFLATHTCYHRAYPEVDHSVCDDSSWPDSLMGWVVALALLPPTNVVVLTIAVQNLRLARYLERLPVHSGTATLIYLSHFLMWQFIFMMVSFGSVGPV